MTGDWNELIHAIQSQAATKGLATSTVSVTVHNGDFYDAVSVHPRELDLNPGQIANLVKVKLEHVEYVLNDRMAAFEKSD